MQIPPTKPYFFRPQKLLTSSLLTIWLFGASKSGSCPSSVFFSAAIILNSLQVHRSIDAGTSAGTSSVERTRPSDPPTYTLGPNPVWEPDADSKKLLEYVTCSDWSASLITLMRHPISGYCLSWLSDWSTRGFWKSLQLLERLLFLFLLVVLSVGRTCTSVVTKLLRANNKLWRWRGFVIFLIVPRTRLSESRLVWPSSSPKPVR